MLTFIIAAHNEEKIIGRTLENLLRLPYDDYEVLVGLDGCTDGTEEIVRGFCSKSSKFRYKVLDIREGKPAVVDALMPEAKGELIVINDADWIFRARSREDIEKLVRVFEDVSVGGITESYPVEWDEKNLEVADVGYKMVAYSAYYWMEFQKKKYGFKKGELWYINSPALFMTNIFRKKLYKKNLLLGDDFERTVSIMEQGYSVVAFDDHTMPRMRASYNSLRVRDLFKQKVRTARARAQLKESGAGVGLGYLVGANLAILKGSLRKGGFIFSLMVLWILITASATFYASFSNFGTTEGWKMRMQR